MNADRRIAHALSKLQIAERMVKEARVELRAAIQAQAAAKGPKA